MRQIFTIGETVYDVIFKNGEPLTARPGGAMLNSAISLGRLQTNVHFVSEYANDPVGKLINKFLEKNNVSTRLINQFDNGKSALALAFLDQNNDASYTFYKEYPPERLTIEMPDINPNDIVLFGSFYSITPEVRKQLLTFVKKAKQNNAIVVYDPNFRSPHSDQLDKLRPMIEENIALADIVRGSDEDFLNIFGTQTPEKTFEKTSHLCPNLIYTANRNGIFLQTTNYSTHFSIQAIEPVSTIGAGDNFNAGIIYAILKNQILKKDIKALDCDLWQSIVNTGASFAANVCMSYDNYISEEFAESLSRESA